MVWEFFAKTEIHFCLDGGGDFAKWNYIYVLLKKEKKGITKTQFCFVNFQECNGNMFLLRK